MTLHLSQNCLAPGYPQLQAAVGSLKLPQPPSLSLASRDTQTCSAAQPPIGGPHFTVYLWLPLMGPPSHHVWVPLTLLISFQEVIPKGKGPYRDCLVPEEQARATSIHKATVLKCSSLGVRPTHSCCASRCMCGWLGLPRQKTD